MRQLVFIVLVSSLLAALVLGQTGTLPAAGALPSIYQGDLILAGNNVTRIENKRFDINGSIIVEENATLVLKDAVLNFTCAHEYQFGMTFQNPLNGAPRLAVDNATITSSAALYVRVYANTSVVGAALSAQHPIMFFTYGDSSISLSNSSFGSDFHAYDSSLVTVSDSSFRYLIGWDDAYIAAANCTITGNLNVYQNSTVHAVDCTIHNVNSHLQSANCSFTNLQSGLVSYWNLRLNSSIMLAPTGWTPNITLLTSYVGWWSFNPDGSANITISNSELAFLDSYGSASSSVYNSSFGYWVTARGSSTCHLHDTPAGSVYAKENATIWLVNSTCSSMQPSGSGRIYVGWHLDVAVQDSLGQAVPSANVTVMFSNSTEADAELTDASGWARFRLVMEKMVNATGEYPVGNYTVEATYGAYSDYGTTNMTENKQITLTLADFIIPEFPSSNILTLFIVASLLAVAIYRRKALTQAKRLGKAGIRTACFLGYLRHISLSRD